MVDKVCLLLVVVLALFGGQGMTQAETATSVGRDFYFGIPLTPAGQSPRYKIVVGTPSSTATYAIESRDGVISSGTATSSSPGVVLIENDLQVTSSGFSDRMKGIRVYVTGPNPIYVLVVIKYNLFDTVEQLVGYGSYPIHPNYENNNVDEYIYYALSTDYAGDADVTDRESNILLVGNQDGTIITITPTRPASLPQDAQSSSIQVMVTAGTSHTVTLDSFQTLGFSSLLDLTGTKIASNKPLTVISGHQCGQIPVDVDFCEPLYVHLPPTFNWGTHFLLAPFGARTANQQYKYVTTEDSTTVTYRCGTQASESLEVAVAGSGQLLFVPTPSYCYLTASSPIFLVQVSPGRRADNIGDSAMSIVPHTAAHVTSSSFYNIPNDFTTSLVTVTVQAQHFTPSDIQLDGATLSCSWRSISNVVIDEIVGYGCTHMLAAGTHTISHSGEGGVLSVMVYGWNNSLQTNFAYAYLANLNFESLEQPTAGTTGAGGTGGTANTDDTDHTVLTAANTFPTEPTEPFNFLPVIAGVVPGVIFIILITVIIVLIMLVLRRKKCSADLGRSSEMQQPDRKNTAEDIPMGSNLAYTKMEQPFSAPAQQEKLIGVSQNAAYVATLPKKPTATPESEYEVPDPAQQNYYAPVGVKKSPLSASTHQEKIDFSQNVAYGAKVPPFSASAQQEKIDFSENVAYGAKVSDVNSDALYEDPDYVIP